MAGFGKPFKKGEGGRPKGVKNKATREIQEAARGLLEDPAYVEALKLRLKRGTAGAVETLLYHYAYGKPKDTLSVEGSIPPFILRVEPNEPEDDPGASDGF